MTEKIDWKHTITFNPHLVLTWGTVAREASKSRLMANTVDRRSQALATRLISSTLFFRSMIMKSARQW